MRQLIPAKTLMVGIDFDNTLACYDEIFHQVARERDAVPADTPRRKESVRNALRETGREDLWTELQGYVYGARMADVPAFPGALECLARLEAEGIPFFIISHKTRRPYRGEPYDLHASARAWLDAHGINHERVFFNETKEEKLRKIAACGCTHFIDDLPEFLGEPSFPSTTEKILFSPGDRAALNPEEGVKVFGDWSEITDFLLSCDGEDVRGRVEALIPDAGPVTLERLRAGGNNRLYRVEAGSQHYIAKHYFTHPRDSRDRLRTEFDFISFARQRGIDCLPRAIVCDDEHHLGLYSLVKGSKLTPEEVDAAAVKSALDFMEALNRHRDQALARLPAASEACFSVRAHLDMMEARLERLRAITDEAARRFVNEEVTPVWNPMKAEILSEAGLKGIDPDEVLAIADRVLSPSDFGFHNCLIEPDGKVVFLDFEYAGWDDPAKTIGDFFSQLSHPVGMEHFEMFSRGVAALTRDPQETLRRAQLLFPLYRLKWCFIALNEFVRGDLDRRCFAGLDSKRNEGVQLVKARRILESLSEMRLNRS